MDGNAVVSQEDLFTEIALLRDMTDASIAALAKCHRICLPNTTSSRAGIKALYSLYRTMISDPFSHIVWRPGRKEALYLGAFASGTMNLRATEREIKKRIDALIILKLAFQNVLNPRHLLVRKLWDSVIPREGVGYILTIGVTREAREIGVDWSGSSLLGELEDWFRAHGVAESWVDTERSNVTAVKFYQKMEYEEVSETYGNVLMKKMLSQ